MKQSANTKTPALRFPGFKGEWVGKKLGDFTIWSSGGTPAKDDKSFWDGDIPWISASSMRGTKYFDSELKITKKGLENGSKISKKGSLLLLVRGSMLFKTIPIGLVERDLAFNQDVKSISVKNGLNNDYLLYWFLSSEANVLNMVTGTGIGAGKLDTNDLKLLEIHIPPLPEQEKIAAFLGAVDEKIRGLKKRKDLLEQYKKGIMQQIFSRRLRFKDEKGKDFPDWEEKRLGEVVEIRKGEQLNREELMEIGTYPCINGGVNPSGFTDKFNTTENTITISEGGNSCGYVNFFRTKFWCGGHCYTIQVNDEEKISKYCLHQILKAKETDIMNLRVGSGLPNIQKKDISNYRIRFPVSFEEQTKISEFLAALDEKISQATLQITQTENWKKGLLQQLFC